MPVREADESMVTASFPASVRASTPEILAKSASEMVTFDPATRVSVPLPAATVSLERMAPVEKAIRSPPVPVVMELELPRPVMVAPPLPATMVSLKALVAPSPPVKEISA